MATAFKPICAAAKKSAEFSCKSRTFCARSSPASARILSLTFRAPARAISVNDKKPAPAIRMAMITIFWKMIKKN